MNEFTFFYKLRAWVFHPDGTPYPQNSIHEELYVVRMRTKYTRTTACRQAKELVGKHVRQKVAEGELTIRNTYWKERYHDGSFQDRHLVEPFQGSWVHGHPQFIRIDQPEGSK